MAIFRKIHVQFWSDVFIQSLTPEKKFFFLYLLTNEKTKQCGIYEITTRHISYDTGYNIETVLKLLEFFNQAGKVRFSAGSSEIAIKNWEKYNGSRSPDIQNLVNKELKFVKNRELIEWIQSVDTVLPQYKSSLRGEPEPEPEREPEPEPEREPVVEGKNFEKLTGFKNQEKTEIEIAEVGTEAVVKIANKVWEDEAWKQAMCSGLSIKISELKKWLSLFNTSVATATLVNFNKGSYMRMSRGWISKQKSKGVTVDSDNLQKTSEAAPLTRIS